MNLLLELLNDVNRMLVKSLHSYSGIIRARLLALISGPNLSGAQEHMVLKYLSMKS